MSQKRDPLATLINYFTTADLAQANQALAVVKEIVRSRQPPAPAASHKAKSRAGGDPVTRRKAPPGLPARPTSASPAPVPPPGGQPVEGFPSL